VFAFLEVFESHAFYIHRVPAELTASVVSMAVEGGNNPSQTELHSVPPQRAAEKGLVERAHDVIPKRDVATV
jgi:hypothetical protein